MYYQYTQFIKGYTDFLYALNFTFYASSASIMESWFWIRSSFCISMSISYSSSVLPDIAFFSNYHRLEKSSLFSWPFWIVCSILQSHLSCRWSYVFQQDNQSMCLVYPSFLPSCVLQLDIASPIYLWKLLTGSMPALLYVLGIQSLNLSGVDWVKVLQNKPCLF